jgi:putative transcriptional regulator
MTGEELGEKLLQSIREMKAGIFARKTEYLPLEDGRLRRLVTLADGTVEKDEVFSVFASTRMKAGLTQRQFAKLLGVSVRTLQEWEQGRKQPSGAAKTLLRIAQLQPEVLKALADELMAA